MWFWTRKSLQTTTYSKARRARLDHKITLLTNMDERIPGQTTFRVMGPHERGRFAPEAWGHLLSLNGSGAINGVELEHIIERALCSSRGGSRWTTCAVCSRERAGRFVRRRRQHDGALKWRRPRQLERRQRRQSGSAKRQAMRDESAQKRVENSKTME